MRLTDRAKREDSIVNMAKGTNRWMCDASMRATLPWVGRTIESHRCNDEVS